nr:uncharacterized protein LOC106025607 isoform X2 [Cavia porcellus]
MLCTRTSPLNWGQQPLETSPRLPRATSMTSRPLPGVASHGLDEQHGFLNPQGRGCSGGRGGALFGVSWDKWSRRGGGEWRESQSAARPHWQWHSQPPFRTATAVAAALKKRPSCSETSLPVFPALGKGGGAPASGRRDLHWRTNAHERCRCPSADCHQYM